METGKIIPLQQLYLSALVAVINDDKLEAVQQELGQDSGRLFMVSTGTTVPVAQLAYKFNLDEVTISIVTRDERQLSRSVKYIEGIDGYLEEMQKFLRANRITHKRAA